MIEKYNNGIAFVINSLNSESHKRAYRCCYKRLKAYLESSSQEFSLNAANSWLEIVKNTFPKSCFTVYRAAVYRLDEYLNTGEIKTPRRMFPFENAAKYARLSTWSRNLLDDTLADTSFHGEGKNYFRISVADFLFYVEENRGSSKEDINMPILRKYLVNLKAIWSHKAYIDRLNFVFAFMSMISTDIESDVFFRYHANSPLVIFEELEQDSQALIYEAKSVEKIKRSLSEVYEWIISIAKVKESEISANLLSKYKARWNSFFLFLILNEIPFSEKAITAWLKITNTKNLPLLHEQYRFEPIIPRNQPEDILPDWSKYLLLEFLDSERKKGKAERTICSTKYACIRFLSFVEINNVSSCSEFTPDLLDQYNRWDTHKTNEGKKGTNSKVRRFIEYLGETNKVNPTLYLALPCKMASQVRTVKILSEDEIQKIYSSKSTAMSPIELRDSAIVFLGLRTGLRAGDIVSMKFCDIDWQSKVIHVVQNKTKNHLVLPMPNEVGNCIYRYIQSGRPNSSSELIFLSHRAPFNMLKASSCADALNRMLNEKRKYGFHITRKTFASRILQAGNSVDSVVNLLGHDGDHTVMKYLATDETKMRMCAIPAVKVVNIND